MKRNVVAINKATTKDTWCTPPAIFAALNEQFGPFDLDLTARCVLSNRICGHRARTYRAERTSSTRC